MAVKMERCVVAAAADAVIVVACCFVVVLASVAWPEAWQLSRRSFSGQSQGWKTPDELGLSKFLECDTFSFSAVWR